MNGHVGRRAAPLALAVLTLAGCAAGGSPPRGAATRSPGSSSSPGGHLPGHLVDVPGTHVSLVPPEDFVASTDFPGFVLEEEEASIRIGELPGPKEQTLSGMTPEGLASQGMTLVRKEELTVNGGPATIIEATQEAGEDTFAKSILILGDEQTAMVTATHPANAEIGR